MWWCFFIQGVSKKTPEFSFITIIAITCKPCNRFTNCFFLLKTLHTEQFLCNIRQQGKTKCSSEVDKFELIVVARSTFVLKVISEHLKRSQTGHWLTLIPLNEPLEAPSYWNWSTKLLDYFQIGFLSKYAIIQNKKFKSFTTTYSETPFCFADISAS